MDRVTTAPSKYKYLSHYLNKVTYSQHVNKHQTLKIPLKYEHAKPALRKRSDSLKQVEANIQSIIKKNSVWQLFMRETCV